MHYSDILNPVKKLLQQGELEAAYEQLVRWLEQSPAHAELTDIARVNQAEVYQVKAEQLKGTWSDEEVRRAYNRLTDKALQIIRCIETGKTTLSTSVSHTRPRSWRYYLIGGLIALISAAVGAWFYFVAAEDCPHFSDSTRLRILILPFKDAGPDNDPAIDIMDELNDWLDRSPQLRDYAIAAVHQSFDIENNYPNSAQAVEVGRDCGAQMVVWGKVRRRPDGTTFIDARYKIFDPAPPSSRADTALQRLLMAMEEADLSSEPMAIARMLYVAISNHRRVPILAAALSVIQKDLRYLAQSQQDSAALPPIDSTASLLLADYYILNNQPDKAIAEYDKVLEYYPDNQTAHIKRGALLLQRGHYEAAARDLEFVQHVDTTLLPAFRQSRVEAFLKSSQPYKALQEMEKAQREGSLPAERIQEKERQVRDTMAALEQRRELLEQKAARTSDPKTRLGAAKTNLALGDAEKAAQQAKEVLRRDPKNTSAAQIVIEAELQKGDTAEARRVLKQTIRRGATAKGIPPEMRLLLARDSIRTRQ